MDVGETALRDEDRLQVDLKLAMDFRLLARGTFSRPGGDIFAQPGSDKPRRNEPMNGKSVWACNAMDVLKHRPTVLRPHQRSPHAW